MEEISVSTRRILTLLVMMLAVALVFAACNTAVPADEDLQATAESAAEEIEDVVDAAATEAAAALEEADIDVEEVMEEVEAAATEVMEEVEEVVEEATAEAATEEEPTAEAPAEEAGLDLSDTEISFWHVWGTGTANEGMLAIVDEFNANNEYGITVVPVDQGQQGDLEQAVNAAVASGDLPNVTLGFANSLANWYNAGVIRPLNEFLEDPQYGLTAEELAALYPGPFGQGTLADGTQVGYPMHQSANVIFYNKTWAEELGFDAPPATSAEFKEQACAATAANAADDDPDNDGTGGLVHFPGASNIASWVYAFGGDIINEARDNYDLNSQVMLDVALFLKDLQDSGCTFATDSFPNPEFATRKALFTTSSTAGIPFQLAAFEDAASDDEWVLLPFPGPDGNLAVNAFGQMIGIVGSNPEQDLASWLWIKHLTSPEVQAQWIESSAYFPSQTTAVDLVSAFAAENPIWAQGLELSGLGKSEPNLPAHGVVRGLIQDAFFAIAEAADEAAIQAILDQLQADAETEVSNSQ
jgi:ABC-type glycerol-3-phosphate transport system substrate-binding protein